MRGTGAGWDSWAYRLYIIGGLIGIVSVVILAALRVETLDLASEGRQSYVLVASLSCLTPYLLGILGYWWWQFLFEDYGGPGGSAGEEGEAVPGIKALRSWTTLFEAMIVYGGDPGELSKARREGRRALIEWFGWASLIALWPIGAAWLYALGYLSQGDYAYVAVGIVALVALMLVRTFFLFRRADAAGDASVFEPLGLARQGSANLVELAARVYMDPSFSGAAMVEGVRHGRPVIILIDGRHTLTMVRVRVPPFAISSAGGRLTPESAAPGPVLASLKRLRKAKRWQGVEVRGSAEGIQAERTSRGQNMWLYDLWLIERLLEEFERGEGQGAPPP